MTDIASALFYAGYVLLALALAALQARRPEAHARRVSTLLIAYVLVVSFGAVVTQRNFWPFSNWRLVPVRAPSDVGAPGGPWVPDVVGVTADGREYPIDARAWEPFTYEELMSWLVLNLPRSTTAQRDAVGAFLLESANRARVATREGRSPGSVTGFLGPLAAPSHLLPSRRWRRPDDAPAAPFVQVRLYAAHWNIEARARGTGQVSLERLYRYPESP